MRPSPLLLNNVHTVAVLLHDVVSSGKPTECRHCARSLVAVRERYARFDAIAREWIGFVECPGCRAAFIYIRDGAPPEGSGNDDE